MTWYAIQHKPAQGDRAINISITVVYGQALFLYKATEPSI
jgi:hypothetical protein